MDTTPRDTAPFARIDSFVAATRTAIHVRRQDRLLMIRPEKTLGINDSAVEILSALYDPKAGPSHGVVQKLASRYGVEVDRIASDAAALLDTIASMMRDDFQPRANVKYVSFDRSRLRYPVLAEIALTYRCQNRCTFCYAASPTRRDHGPLMSTEQVKRVIDRIYHEAHVPTLSFTGGEATLRKDLPELVRHGSQLGLRINLITNGLRAAKQDYARCLVDHGLASAQVSIEAATAELHDRIVGRQGAFARTVAGIRAFRQLGIHVHTNSTLCTTNIDQAQDIIAFVSEELGLSTLSMNMLIRTGNGLDPSMPPITYAQIAKTLPMLIEEAHRRKVKFVWYSPLPYCVVNPVLLGQGAKSCACVSGIVSVNPAGELLPCSSFQEGIGSLLHRPFEEIYDSPQARYWRDRRYIPPACRTCPDVDVCAGACPLYWDAVGNFSEIPQPNASDPSDWQRWKQERIEGGSFGVPRPVCDQGK
ncbi:MAG TPA: radical SAM protein [Polyangiaceae bacterium]|jgi:radical SAM protein with 4Fe4S-binding SPASM domain|nr:MAG: Antilisterial bacteriocin subtilosin biosynthesis protein AlbA [Deltaproteobacteria bacterium ADurb.Bin207]HNS99489.1 radical SAM protein [Polyangiaceae bacterium]HNZ24835.1 radical SAM protein [Polyangiaceae bacterium]HOD22043.1 radical SAM protein [Polyangiaceae bacterium]HOE50671.1 radical SAM protein [Polyangiaceae bacterium]